MKLLMVTAGLPGSAGGANTRNFHLLKTLSQKHTVLLLVLANDTELRDVDQVSWLNESANSIQLIHYELPNRFKHLNQLLSAIRGRSYFLNLFIIPEMQYALDALCSEHHFDLVLFESVLVAGYRLPLGMKMVIDQHNIEHELLERTFKHEKTLLRKWFSWNESRLLKRGELERCRKASAVLVTSERERTTLKHLLPEQRVEVIPNGVDIATFIPRDSVQEIAHRLIFTGSMDYYPNSDAVLFFARECWPRIHEQVPDATWLVVGKNPPDEINRLAELPGVTVTGTVPGVKPYLESSAVVIAPLRVGSGTRLKILEALAMRKAVVSTTIGCEGLDVKPGKHLLIAEQSEEFIKAILMLFNNQEKRTSLGKAGRALVEAKYSWVRAGTQLLRVLDKSNFDCIGLVLS
jgi:sugar transferase (PEP-CTERM/EpsH1 system associated)